MKKYFKAYGYAAIACVAYSALWLATFVYHPATAALNQFYIPVFFAISYACLAYSVIKKDHALYEATILLSSLLTVGSSFFALSPLVMLYLSPFYSDYI